MGRKSLKDTRRKEIIEIFYRVAKKEGLENTSIAKIAKVMDINPSLIIHYFQTKEDLVYGLIDYILDKYLLIFKVPKRNGSALDTLLKVIDHLFSKRWNALFDDGVSYSCYAMVFREKKIKARYKQVLDSLHVRLADVIASCTEEGVLDVKDPRLAADLIFVIVDGAYYYLSLVNDRAEYALKLENSKHQALKVLGLDGSLPGKGDDRIQGNA